MTSMIFLAILRDDKIDQAFARFKATMHQMTSYEVQVVSTDNRRPKVEADFIVDARKRLLYAAKTPDGPYILSITPAGYREVNAPSKNYDETPYGGSAEVHDSRLSKIPSTIPNWLAVPDLHYALPPQPKLSFRGVENAGGFPCDVIRATFKAADASGFVDIYIAKSGLVYRFAKTVDSLEGHRELVWSLSNYRPFHTIDASRFENRIPDGYMPYSLPDEELPAVVGRKPDLTGWVDSKSGKPWQKPSSRPILFLVTTAGSLPCARAVDALISWESALREKGITVAFASDSTSASGAKGFLYNPGRHSLNDLDAPSTPMLYLIGSDGKLRNLWMGFVPAEKEKMRDELFKAIAALK